MAFITENWAVIVGFLLALSELLALIPKVKANSVFQLALNILKKASEKLEVKKIG